MTDSASASAVEHAHADGRPSTRDAKVIVTAAMFVLFLGALEQTIVSTALPAIFARLGDVELGSWVITAYLISSVCATPVIGKLSDMFGRTIVVRVCLGLFIGGSMLCGLAPGMPVLIAARAVQGLGGGGLIVMAQTMVGDAVSPRERGRYAAYFSIVWASAAVLGPIVGGVLTAAFGWPWIFWINVPLGIAALALSERGLRLLRGARRGAASVDVRGIALLSLTSLALLLLVSRPRTLLAWDLLSTALLGIALVSGALFVRHERKVTEPIIPPDFLHHPVITPVLAASMLIFGSYIGLTVVTPLYLQLGVGLTSAQSGLLLVPMMVASTISSYAAGRYNRKHGRYRAPPLATLPVAIAGCALLALALPHGNVGVVTALNTVIALGIGTIFPCVMVAAQAAAGKQHLGAVNGAVALSRALGASIVTGLLMAVLLLQIARAFPELASLSSIEELLRRPIDANAHAALMRAFAPLAWVVTASMALGLLAFMRVEDRDL